MVGVILLVDDHRDAIGGAGDLRHRIDEQTVVFLAVVCGHDIETVADLEEGGEVVLVSCGIVACEIVLAELVCQLFQCGLALVVQGRQDLHCRFGIGKVLGALQKRLHGLGCHWCPGTVFKKGYGTVAEVAFDKVFDELPHEGEDIRIVCSGGENDTTVSEGVGHSKGHIGTGQVVNDHFGAPFRPKLLSQDLHRFSGVSVDRGVGDQDPVFLHAVT